MSYSDGEYSRYRVAVTLRDGRVVHELRDARTAAVAERLSQTAHGFDWVTVKAQKVEKVDGSRLRDPSAQEH